MTATRRVHADLKRNSAGRSQRRDRERSDKYAAAGRKHASIGYGDIKEAAMEFVTLQGRDGAFAMPAVGFGTWKAASGQAICM